MRAPSDMPPREPRERRRRLSGRGRTILIVVLVALFFLATSLRGIAGVWTDYLFFESLDLETVWRGVLGARVALGVIVTGVFFLLLWSNLVVADRLGPRARPAGPEEELLERYHQLVGRRAGLVRIAVAGVFAVIAGAGVSSQWQDWILFTNRVDFGIEDPQFGVDIGFYVFQLPFLSFVVSWLFAAFVIVLIVVVVAHYLNGGIRVQSPGQRVTPQVKAHLSVLLGVMALIKAADYWLQRFELTYSTRGAVDGALYTDINAQLPAIYLLLMISLLSAVLFLVNIRRRGWVLPVLAVGLWLFVAIVAGTLYPAFVQRFQVEPAESTKEEPYIQRNIDATRAALALDVDTEPFQYDEDLDAAALVDNEATVRNIRLLDPNVVNQAYQQLQGERGFYTFPEELDVDRYEIDGQTTQVVLAGRELDTGDIPQDSWEGQRLAYTHGYGVALSPANAVTSDGSPDFVVGNVPTVSDVPEIEVDRPQLYIGEGLGGYAIVDTTREEVDYLDAEGNTVTSRFEGEGGVGIGTFWRQAAFALRFGDIDPLVSNFLTPESRIIYERDVRSRVETVAPFLEWDSDAYPVIADGGISYVLDGYTTSDTYPYSQTADVNDMPEGSGLNGSFNYVRNSVKAVVDGYDGSVTLYVLPEDMLPEGGDPIIEAYRQAFPELFEDFEDMPEDLQAHVRYPDDLFRVQTNMWGRYHIGDANDFYEQTGGWAVSQAPGDSAEAAQEQTVTTDPNTGEAVEVSQRRIDPYYQLMRLPGEEEEQFLSLRPFVPASGDDSRRQLTAFMTAISDPERYGELRVFEMPGTQVDGPTIANANMLSDPEVSQQVTLLDQQGSQITLGNMLLIPVDQSLMYIRPLYTEASSTQVPRLQRVIISYGNEIVIENTLREGLVELFGEAAPETQEEGPDDPDEGDEQPDPDPGTGPTDEPEEDDPEVPTGDEDVAELLAQADQALADAEAALEAGDLGTYQDKVDEARDLVDRALGLSGGGTTTTTAQPSDSA
jgi:uncharacterized membrane protein (UPF0182 family)